jgi:hypothetical protein
MNNRYTLLYKLLKLKFSIYRIFKKTVIRITTISTTNHRYLILHFHASKIPSRFSKHFIMEFYKNNILKECIIFKFNPNNPTNLQYFNEICLTVELHVFRFYWVFI